MRRIALAFVPLLCMAGCNEGEITMPDSPVGITFRLTEKCEVAGTMDFYIDGQHVGRETLPQHGASKEYPTTRERHELAAVLVLLGSKWGPVTVDMGAVGYEPRYTMELNC